MDKVTFSSCYKITGNPDELREAARQIRSDAAFAHGQTYQDAMHRAAELDARADKLERLIAEAERNGTGIHNGSIFNADCNWDSDCDSGSSDCGSSDCDS